MRRSYRIGEATIGVRTTSGAFGDWLDHALDRYRVDSPADPEYSIVIDGGERDDARRGKRFHVLYQGVGVVTRTMHLPTLARSFLSELEARLLHRRDDGVYVHYGLAWSGGTTVLLPAWLVSYLGGTGRRLPKAGIAVSPRRWVRIDTATREVQPAPPLLDLSDDAMERLVEPTPDDRHDGATSVDGPRAVSAVLTYVDTMDTIAGGTRGTALYHLAAATANLPVVGSDGIETLAGVVGRAHCFETGLGRTHQMLAALGDVFAHERSHANGGSG